MGDQRNVKAQLQSNRARIAKAPAGNERDAHPLFACIINCEAIALRNTSTRIEQSPVQIESQKTYRHMRRNKVKEANAEGKGSPANGAGLPSVFATCFQVQD